MENNIEMINKDIGLRIRKEREGLKLSREDFAEIIGLSDYYIGQLERGERQMSLPSLVKVANCLHISLDYLVFGIYNDSSFVNEPFNNYEINSKKLEEINKLLNKCSSNELELFNKLIRTLLPHLNNK